MPSRLWYREPAEYWTQALPLGNGRLGAMAFGGVPRERLALNEDSLWSGPPDNQPRPQARAAWQQAGALVREGNTARAEALLESDFLSEYSQAYMPLGDLLLDFNHRADTGSYQRELRLEEAIHRVRYTAGGVPYEREAFISAPDQVLVLRLRVGRPGALDFIVGLNSPLRGRCEEMENGLLLRGQCPSRALPGYLNHPEPLSWEEGPRRAGIRFACLVKVVTDGRVDARDGRLWVEGASQATLVLACRSNFAGFDKLPETAGLPFEERAQKDLDAALHRLAALKERHVAEHSAWYSRMRLQLRGPDKQDVPTNLRLRAFRDKPEDTGLVQLLFDYGRYLLISSSRPGSQPANLQGIWNESTTPPWSSNYTTNINLQMNYWPALPLNLAETQQPLNDMVKELARSGQETAREYYGARGFVCHHNTDLWRHSRPVGGGGGRVVWGYWPHAGAWLCAHLADYWRYTADMEFLRGTAWPACWEAALFYLDTLQEDAQGRLAFCPDTSPENSYQKDGQTLALSASATMSRALVMELFTNCLEMADALGIADEFTRQLQEALPRLAPPETGRDGRLLEWDEEYQEAEPHHRHLSHLYALHPGRLINPKDTPDLARACEKSLLARGDEGTGWSLGWKISQWARLGKGEHALELIRRQLRPVPSAPGGAHRGGSYDNLFGAHPPFQIDGNFGLCAGVAEMLLQNRRDGLWLLPALPPDWWEGSAEGLRAFHGLTVSLWWAKGRLTRCKLQAGQAVSTTLFLPDGRERAVRLAAGESADLRF